MFRRRGNVLPTSILVILDALLINAAFLLAWWIRYDLQLVREVADGDYVTVDAYFAIQLATTLILLAVFKIQGLYSGKTRAAWMDSVGVIMSGTTIGVAIMIVAIFGFRPYAYSRLLFLYLWFLIVGLLSLLRLAKMQLRAYLRKRGHGLDRVLVVGAGQQGMLIMQNIVAQPELGYDVVGFVDDERTEDFGRFKALGHIDDVSRIARHTGLNLVIIALPSASHTKILEIMMQCSKQNVDFRIVPDFYELSLRNVDVDEINGIPLIGLKEVSMGRLALLVKRMIDVAVSAVVMVVSSPLIMLIALAIKLDTPGPVLYTQSRVGRGGRRFTCFKFRSMKVGAEQEIDKLRQLNEITEITFKDPKDPRVTAVGRIIRRLSLDELPQFYNILIGDMSVVGPRPPTVDEVERYEDWHHKRLEVSPGLTGLWQVNGRSKLPFVEMVLLDIWYIENWSLALDLKIMLRTVPAVLLARGAY